MRAASAVRFGGCEEGSVDDEAMGFLAVEELVVVETEEDCLLARTS